MSRDQANAGRSELKYMGDVKDFAKAKNKGLALDCYTNLKGVTAALPNRQCASSSLTNVSKNEGKSVREKLEAYRTKLIEELKEKRKDLAAKEHEAREAAEEQKRITAANELAEQMALSTAEKIEKNKLAALEKGLDLSKIKASDSSIFSSIAKEIEKYNRTTKQNSLAESDIEQIRLKLTEAAQKQSASSRRKWADQPQHSWSKLAQFVASDILNDLRKQIENVV